MLHYLIILSTLLMTAVNVRAQCERPAVGEKQILTDDSDRQTFPDGSTVNFRCSTGYVPVSTSASRSITCARTRWSELKLQCKKKSCGNPGEIHHGKYLFPEGILFGATITAQCNEGFWLVGQPSRNCRETGWDGRAPVCEVVKCLMPPSITNGIFDPVEDSYDYGEAVIYTCKGGLDLIGPSEITCSADGTFQPLPPRCLLVSCESPKIPNAVRIEGKSPPYKYNNFIRYRCNKGYRMEGSDFLICKEDGWDPSPPQCTVITCLKPPAIDNGLFNPLKELYEYGQTVTYSCNEGFRLSGASTIACTDDGTFQTSPQCLEIFCDPPAIPNAVIDESSPPYRYGVSVQIRCNKGYRIVGSDKLTCWKYGWIPALSQCIEVTCDVPNINNAVIVGRKSSSYNYKMSIRYQCNKGYRMEGSDLLTCEENGWNPPPPKCNIVTCLKPLVINDGHVNPLKERYEYGQTVTYSCKEGFRLQGASTISCTDDGTFQPSPQCVEVTCDVPNINNAVIVGRKSSSYNYKMSIWYQCNKGYRMEGSDLLTCEENGWNPPPPMCNIVTCLKPPVINDGHVNPLKERYEYGQTVTYSCKEGFRLQGASTISCTDDGTFQPSPQCVEKSCGSLGELSNGRYLIPNGILFGATAFAECNEGYLLVGPKTRNCVDSGWDQRAAVCEAVKCLPPPAIQNGNFHPTEDSYNYKEAVTYSCSVGFTLIGEDTITCSDDGTFHPSPPQCLEVTCKEPQIKHACIIEGKSIYYGYKSSVRVQCKTLYKMKGSEYLTCEEDGWNPPPPRCRLNLKKICSLVNRSSSTLTTEEPSPKSMY